MVLVADPYRRCFGVSHIQCLVGETVRQSPFFPSLAEGESMSLFFFLVKRAAENNRTWYVVGYPHLQFLLLWLNLKITCKESEKVGLKLNIQKTKIMASGPITSWEIDEETVDDFIFLGSKITADGDCSHEIKRLTPWKESHDQPRQHIKNQKHYFANTGPSSQGYGFSSGHVWM